nr:YcxB family protein [Brevundimonas sp. P7753]
MKWRWSIDQQGLLFENGLQSNRLDWAGVKTVQEEADRFLFLVTPSNNPVLPKRLLDGDQMDRFRALVAEAKASGRLGGGVDYQAPSSDKA